MIVVGRILEYSDVGRPHPSKWIPNFPVQLGSIKIQVENVLQGEDTRGDISVFFFRYLAISEGAPRIGVRGRGGTWRIGDREIFFLQRDSGVLRTVCDGWAHCVMPVLTGAHPEFKSNPNSSNTAIIDILLTRGEGCSDQQMVDAISQFRAYDYGPDYTIKKLNEIARTETPKVRKAACQKLKNLGKPCLE
jgi:hypothetical protein